MIICDKIYIIYPGDESVNNALKKQKQIIADLKTEALLSFDLVWTSLLIAAPSMKHTFILLAD
jgi:hypothetical protein